MISLCKKRRTTFGVFKPSCIDEPIHDAHGPVERQAQTSMSPTPYLYFKLLSHAPLHRGTELHGLHGCQTTSDLRLELSLHEAISTVCTLATRPTTYIHVVIHALSGRRHEGLTRTEECNKVRGPSQALPEARGAPEQEDHARVPVSTTGTPILYSVNARTAEAPKKSHSRP